MTLINDPQLIGFWPLNEPSGAPYFKNYGFTWGGKPSGISFDLHVQQSIAQTALHSLSEWPGTTAIFNNESGVTYRGLQLHGTYQSAVVTSRHAKTLTIGRGTYTNRIRTLIPALPQSGFTFGFWVYPNSDGYKEYIDLADNGTRQHAWGNALMGRGDDDFGIWMGVSGRLNGGAQFNSTREGGPHLLTGYLYVVGTDTDNPFTATNAEILESAIESGVFTHLTGTYRYIDGTSNQVVLYKNGRVTASGTTDRKLTINPADAGSTFDDVKWTIGGSVEDATGTPTDRYPLTVGWNHLVSGAYYFNRVLNEGEVLDMHQQGGLQPSLGRDYGDSTAVTLEDSRLIGYYPFAQVGFSDVSAYHRPLIAPVDEGDASELANNAGPFNRGGIYKIDGAMQLVATSGLTFDLATAPAGFSVCLRFKQPSTTTYTSNMLVSMGSTDDILTPVVTDSTLGFHISRDASVDNEKLFARVYPIGADGVSTTITVQDPEQMDQVSSHVAFIYDNGSNGIALYLDGELQSSGTLVNSLTYHLTNLAGSGFPLMFLNGVLDQDPLAPDATSAQSCVLNEIALFNSPLRADEIRSMAYSGIDITPIMRTVNDPRLAGYWPCDDFDGDDPIIQDKAKVWEYLPGHLTYAQNDILWDQVELQDNQGPWIRTDYFKTQTLPNELASYGNLGITSGVFVVHGGSASSFNETTNLQIKSSIANVCLRYKGNTEDNDLSCHSINSEYIIAFDVTPSGKIPPANILATARDNNSILMEFGDNTDRFMAYLSTVNNNLPGSGIAVVFAGNESTLIQPHVSGQIPFGIPSKILLHLRWTNPYESESTAGTVVPFVETMYINGIKVSQKTDFSANARMWSDATPVAAGDNYILQFGGRGVNDATETHATAVQAGLGGNYLRNIMIMRGNFSQDDILYFAASGISGSTALSNYSDILDTTQVTIKNSNLKGYWRFSGQPSGETNLGSVGTDLYPLGRHAINSSANRGTIYNLRYLPGPLENSDLGIKSSGISYLADTTGFTTGPVAPFIASGTAFQSPQNGFSIGFLYGRRNGVATNDTETIVAYGVLPTSTVDTTIQPNAGWAIMADELGSIKMVMSTDGHMYLDSTTSAASSGQVVCGAFVTNPPFDTTYYENFKHGAFSPISLDSIGHYTWTFNATDQKVRCYMNGELIDEEKAPYVLNESGPFNNPRDPSARFISLLVHQEGGVWTFGTTNVADSTYLTDLFYFDDTLTDEEVRYIAFNGIDDAVRTEVSGIVGGYIAGLAQLSGVVGGWTQGVDTISGIIGSFIAGSNQTSGIIGGFTHGLAVVSGTVGGLIIGGEQPSGLIGGFVQGSIQASGFIGGYIIGGLSGTLQFDSNFNVSAIGSKTFDAILEIRKQSFAEFDATVFVYQDEEPPDVGIIIPGDTVTGLAPPFDQYFIGAASGNQGKSIVSTKWTFGDFTGNFAGSVSGGNYYPISHRFATSGLMITRFTAIDSHGIQNSATRIINIASGIETVEVSLSGQPRQGYAELIVDFDTNIDNLPDNVFISRQLVDFDDGKTSIQTNPSHGYTNPGQYTVIFSVLDSRGFVWSDTLNSGSNN